MTLSFTQPICVDCWLEQNPGRQPHQLKIRNDERCCYCGETTRAGIYIRVDPTTVEFATLEK